MGTLTDRGRITTSLVNEEISRLRAKSKVAKQTNEDLIEITRQLVGDARFNQFDRYDQIILAGITDVCINSTSMADAGRTLFNQSRTIKKSTNDSHRIRQLLEKYGLKFDAFNH